VKVGDLVEHAMSIPKNPLGVIVEAANPKGGKMMMFRVYWFNGIGRTCLWYGEHKLKAVKKCP
jgi:hypothetical protein